MNEDYYKEIFSKNLRYFMEVRRKTQADIIRDLGVTRSAVSTWYNGTRLPRMDKVDALAKYLGVNRSDLIEEKRSFIPVYGRVAAGTPLEMISDMEILEETPRDGYFGLKIHGDSMSPTICDGDIVLVKEQPTAETGDIVIATVNGDSAVCKRLRKYADGIELISNNPSYEPMSFSLDEIKKAPVTIIGKVVQLRRNF